MPTWAEVDELAGRLPGAERTVAHDGSPAWRAGRHTFARLRRGDDGGELVQVWTGEMDTEAALAGRRDVFVRIDTFRFRVTMWVRLDRLHRVELAELLLESYDIRGGPRRRGGTGLADLLC
ncbi:MmcQ/YjbR family DNA-binding protein [Terrabacter carboxydivorans]|uniref:YjbR protein n=1 Tax=Terrabacter carboxydivorans TaxID=619730 RepID=A0ABP5ZFS2_9MICO